LIYVEAAPAPIADKPSQGDAKRSGASAIGILMTDDTTGDDGIAAADIPPGLSAKVRQHLGQILRDLYAGERPSEPPSRFAELIARLDGAVAGGREQDEIDFREGFLQAVPSLQNFAMSLTRNPSQADDLVQDTLLRAWRSRAGFAPGTNIGAWLFTIMRNAFYSAHRRRGREVQDTDGGYAGRVGTVPEQGGHLDLQDAQAALGRLSAPMREALVLVAIENLSYEQAAEVLNCRIGTVKSRVWRARDQLAAMLGYSADEVGADHTTLSVLAGGTLSEA